MNKEYCGKYLLFRIFKDHSKIGMAKNPSRVVGKKVTELIDASYNTKNPKILCVGDLLGQKVKEFIKIVLKIVFYIQLLDGAFQDIRSHLKRTSEF
uniref:Uncharacterized protein n=1 Tax=Tetranychus urticae TaxID=32264 RepID=T1KJ77_TETUR